MTVMTYEEAFGNFENAYLRLLYVSAHTPFALIASIIIVIIAIAMAYYIFIKKEPIFESKLWNKLFFYGYVILGLPISIGNIFLYFH